MGRTNDLVVAVSGGGGDAVSRSIGAVGHTGYWYSSAGVSGLRGGGVWIRTRLPLETFLSSTRRQHLLQGEKWEST